VWKNFDLARLQMGGKYLKWDCISRPGCSMDKKNQKIVQKNVDTARGI